MAKAKKQTAAPAAKLTEAKRFELAFASQARIAPIAEEFTAEEVTAFAALVSEERKFAADIGPRFNALWLAHLERRRAAAEAAEDAQPTVRVKPPRGKSK